MKLKQAKLEAIPAERDRGFISVKYGICFGAGRERHPEKTVQYRTLEELRATAISFGKEHAGKLGGGCYIYIQNLEPRKPAGWKSMKDVYIFTRQPEPVPA